uniref:Uncharacterized protein n=1 Tax=Arundo donax TaxID=35708 RepID=A0A0A9B174_ARUDO
MLYAQHNRILAKEF